MHECRDSTGCAPLQHACTTACAAGKWGLAATQRCLAPGILHTILPPGGCPPLDAVNALLRSLEEPNRAGGSTGQSSSIAGSIDAPGSSVAATPQGQVVRSQDDARLTSAPTPSIGLQPQQAASAAGPSQVAALQQEGSIQKVMRVLLVWCISGAAILVLQVL